MKQKGYGMRGARRENMCKLVKTQRLAGWLMYQGYILLRKDKDRKNSNYDIYIFEFKEGIEDEIDNYVKLHSNK